MGERLRVAFAGSGSFGLPTLKTLAKRHDVVRIFTQPDRPAGRGQKLTPTPVGTWADANGLDAVRTPRLDDEVLPDVDALVVIAFGQKIGQHHATTPRLGAMNLHASLLPRHRGAAPIHHALLSGDDPVGNTVIRLAERMDAGAVLRRGEVSAVPNETTGELHDRLAEAGAPLVLRTLADLASGSAVEVAQDESKATHAHKLSRDDARLDFTLPAVDLARRVNGLSPWPGCRVETSDGRRLGLLRACAESDAEGRVRPPGTVDADGFVRTGHGRLRLLDVQPEGGKPMPLEVYRNGRPWNAGTMLTSV